MKHAWFFYIGLLIVLSGGRMAQKIATETGGFGSRYGPVILALVLSLSVYGSVWKSALGHRWVWAAMFWPVALGTAGLAILSVSVLLEGSTRLGGLILTVLLVLVPGLWQLFRYAYRSPCLWNRHA